MGEENLSALVMLGWFTIENSADSTLTPPSLPLSPPSLSPLPRLSQSIEKKMKHLERTPGSLRPPDPATILLNLPWLSGLGPDVVQALLPHAEFVQLEQGDWLLLQGAESRGIYVIVSGLVKVCPIG